MTRRPKRTLLLMCAGMFLVLLDVSVINVAVPAIAAGLSTGTGGVQWVIDAYTIALAALLLSGGAIGDRIGHRRAVLVGLLVFGTASVVCALAPDLAVLAGARAGQGAGAALLLPCSVAVITDAYPGRAEQARALGVWAGVSSLALPAGPLLGGVLVQLLGWRSIFWLNPPIVLAVLAAILLAVPAGRADRARRLDPAGAGLVAVALAALVYAVIGAGRAAGGALVAAAAVVAVCAGAGLVAVERRVAAATLPLDALRGRAFTGANLLASTMNLATNGTLFAVTLYLQSVRRVSPATAGLLLVPIFVPLVALSPVAGRLTARYGPRRPMLAGALLAAAGEVGLLAVPAGAAGLGAGGYLRLLPTLLGVGVGVGLFTAPVVAAALRAAPPGRAGLANGMVNTARQAGTALGVAVFGAVVGAAADPGRFVAGLHRLGVAAALLWLGAAVVAHRVVPAGAPGAAVPGGRGAGHPTAGGRSGSRRRVAP
ncbi:MFS transporter [Actinocatenispora thailandica]|uniref:MFS transporter n=1 Tax=Actinocatenispora thailandica TaxID=227318 RepID=A0A7R7DL21_9ACTN|nr:MFS transporter [Actinocatenispora thailandica]BCJ33536.1 MFS transporter [Actinocatenispora thailandica]